jgi:RNA polymerase sigma factor (sigma-70 family)
MHAAISVQFRYDTAVNRRAPDTLSDEALLAGIADRDEAAFEAFCRRFLQWAYRFDMNILQNIQDAEDAVQEKFMRIWTKAEKYEPIPGSKVTNYLLKIDKNICFDMLRRKYRRQILPADRERKTDGSGQEDILGYLEYCYTLAEKGSVDLESAIVSADLMKRIYDYTLHHFNKRQFLVFWGFISGLSYRELSETYALEQGSVRGYIARGFAAIRKKFAEQRGDHD